MLIENGKVTVEPRLWNCRLWAIYMLFGNSGLSYFFGNPENPFGPSLMDQSVDPSLLTSWWENYNTNNVTGVLKVLNEFNEQLDIPPDYHNEVDKFIRDYSSKSGGFGKSHPRETIKKHSSKYKLMKFKKSKKYKKYKKYKNSKKSKGFYTIKNKYI
jgi:hypothetical protein